MNIAIIGSGNVGRAIGAGLSRTGHDVTFGVRTPDDERHADLDRVATRAAAVDGADIVVLAVPADAVADTVPALGLRDGQIVADVAPEGIALVKAFNTIGFEHMATGEIDGAAVFLPIAGKVQNQVAAVVKAQQMVSVGVIGILREDPPTAIAQRLESFAGPINAGSAGSTSPVPNVSA